MYINEISGCVDNLKYHKKYTLQVPMSNKKKKLLK